MASRLTIALILLALAGCGSKAPQNKDAIQKAIVDHLGKRSDMLASSMKIEVVSVNFREKEADAIVSISPKEGGEGMQMPYSLAMEGDKWIVKRSGSGGAGNNPHPGGAAPSGGSLPEGHPPIGGGGSGGGAVHPPSGSRK